MRIIEPIQKTEISKSRLKKRLFFKVNKKLTFFLCIVALLVLTAWSFLVSNNEKQPETLQTQLAKTSTITEVGAHEAHTKIKTLTNAQFKELYDLMVYPNTQMISGNIPITGDDKADDRIRTLAIARGYKLHSVPVAAIMKIGDPNLHNDDLLQEKALQAWHELQAAAKAAGLNLRIVSGYRSPELQRSLFMNRLLSTGVSIDAVAAGSADAQVDSILKYTAIPGFSRHHTGYTVDFQCRDGSLQVFVSSPCFAWLSKNNYFEAKSAGWIPSYPPGTGSQGPEPEPWEYVWVGKNAVSE